MSVPTRSVAAVFPGRDELDALRQQHYNATVSSIRAHEPELWVMHIAPDGPIAPFEPANTPRSDSDTGSRASITLRRTSSFTRTAGDLAYPDRHRIVEGRHDNYRYVPLTTRELENEGNKVYIQDLLDSGGVEGARGTSIDASHTHFYLCGTPQMIGLPQWHDDGALEFPATRGVCEILTEHGFTLDHRRERGNVHYEEYWKDS